MYNIYGKSVKNYPQLLHWREVFYKNFRIASHKRLFGETGQTVTIPDHMPDKHKQFINFNQDYVLNWASSAGKHILTTVRSMLASYKTEKQGGKSCLGLMKLADKHSIEHFEN